MNAVTAAHGLEISVVIAVFVIRLKDIMVHILDGYLCLGLINPEGFKLQHGHGTCSILKQRVINPYGDLFAGH
jgi:hypothetical protein